MNNVILKPDVVYWAIKNCLAFFILIISAFIFQFENLLLRYVQVFVSFSLLCYIGFSYLTIMCTKWIITEEQIKIYTGVFFKEINYIELYRVYDYEERKNIIQVLIKNVNYLIYSKDKSTPILIMGGVRDKGNIIELIRERVEIQRQNKSIYELINQ